MKTTTKTNPETAQDRFKRNQIDAEQLALRLLHEIQRRGREIKDPTWGDVDDVARLRSDLLNVASYRGIVEEDPDPAAPIAWTKSPAEEPTTIIGGSGPDYSFLRTKTGRPIPPAPKS